MIMSDTKYIVKFDSGNMMVCDNLVEYCLFSGTKLHIKPVLIAFLVLFIVFGLLYYLFDYIYNIIY